MDRNTPAQTTKRTARFSTPAHDEVEVCYPFESVAGHKLNGQQQTVFYPTDLYNKRKKRHGRRYYPVPEPYTNGHFRR